MVVFKPEKYGKKKFKKNAKWILWFVGGALAILIITFGLQWKNNSSSGQLNEKQVLTGAVVESTTDEKINSEQQNSGDREQPPISAKPSAPYKIDENGNLLLQAKSAISVKVENPSAGSGQVEKILFRKSENAQLPIASLTKLMTALIVLENYDLNQEVVINNFTLEQIGEQGQLKLGEKFFVKDLLYSALIESSNRAAYALSKVIFYDFIDLMNQRARELGMTHTFFADSTGLSPESVSTAEDLVKLTRYLYENYPLFAQITQLPSFALYLSDRTFHHLAINTNQNLGYYNIVGGKTGWTPEARGALMTIQKEPNGNGYTINIILGSEDRFGETIQIIEWVNNN